VHAKEAARNADSTVSGVQELTSVYLVAMMQLFDGEDQVLFASDWPHHDFDHPRQVFDLPFSPEAKRKIMGENARRLFGITAPRTASADSRSAIVERE